MEVQLEHREHSLPRVWVLLDPFPIYPPNPSRTKWVVSPHRPFSCSQGPACVFFLVQRSFFARYSWNLSQNSPDTMKASSSKVVRIVVCYISTALTFCHSLTCFHPSRCDPSSSAMVSFLKICSSFINQLVTAKVGKTSLITTLISEKFQEQVCRNTFFTNKLLFTTHIRWLPWYPRFLCHLVPPQTASTARW